ncbi:MAG TPA: phosphoribosylanthranilate isomerase [Desulfobacteraceae bacterium]|nr:phosphoribosylanthranilate isomerase [Desulfobacteraceae bacterium]
MEKSKNSTQIKICGLTRVDEAVKCALAGADAIGCVFYSKSPRFVTIAQAKEICSHLPESVKSVGVFVNETCSNIMQTVERCGLQAVQLHGQELPGLVKELRKNDIIVIKALFTEKEPSLDKVSEYDASAFLLECGRGSLPGGNALKWNWAMAKSFGEKYPLILAGGLAPENVIFAITESRPDAVDVSSGVESCSGRKDLRKVKSFIDAVSQQNFKKRMRRIF